MHWAGSMIVLYENCCRALVVGNLTEVGHLQNATVHWPTETYVSDVDCNYADWIHLVQYKD
jgi:hypothetical protein